MAGVLQKALFKTTRRLLIHCSLEIWK